MYNEYDVVKAKKNLNSAVPQGTLGTVVIVYNSFPKQFEVEFVDKEGTTLAILTLSEEDIEPYQERQKS